MFFEFDPSLSDNRSEEITLWNLKHNFTIQYKDEQGEQIKHEINGQRQYYEHSFDNTKISATFHSNISLECLRTSNADLIINITPVLGKTGIRLVGNFHDYYNSFKSTKNEIGKLPCFICDKNMQPTKKKYIVFFDIINGIVKTCNITFVIAHHKEFMKDAIFQYKKREEDKLCWTVNTTFEMRYTEYQRDKSVPVCKKTIHKQNIRESPNYPTSISSQRLEYSLSKENLSNPDTELFISLALEGGSETIIIRGKMKNKQPSDPDDNGVIHPLFQLPCYVYDSKGNQTEEIYYVKCFTTVNGNVDLFLLDLILARHPNFLKEAKIIQNVKKAKERCEQEKKTDYTIEWLFNLEIQCGSYIEDGENTIFKIEDSVKSKFRERKFYFPGMRLYLGKKISIWNINKTDLKIIFIVSLSENSEEVRIVGNLCDSKVSENDQCKRTLLCNVLDKEGNVTDETYTMDLNYIGERQSIYGCCLAFKPERHPEFLKRVLDEHEKLKISNKTKKTCKMEFSRYGLGAIY